MDLKKELVDKILEMALELYAGNSKETQDIQLQLVRLSAQNDILFQLLNTERPPTEEEKKRGYKQ